MAITINVNGESISYPETGDPNWSDEATDFAVQTASAFGKLGLDIGTSVDIPGTLDVTGATTLDSTLTVAGTTTLNGTANLNGNTNLGNAITDTVAVTAILNVDSGVLYVDPATNKVGINDTTPSVELDVNGSVAVSGTLGVTGDVITSIIKASGSGGLTIDSNGGTDVALFGAGGGAGTTLYGGLNGTTGNFADTTDATSSTDGALKTAGGVGIAKKLFVGTDVTVGGVTYLDDSTTANTPVLSFTGDTNTGIGRSAADTIDIITDGVSKFRIEPTGQIKAVYESSLGTDYNATLHNGYLCRAWVNFDGTSSNLTGTYSRTGTLITVSVTSHGLSSGQSVYLDFTTGTGTDGIYIVTVVNANSYTVTDAVSGSTSGSVTQFRYIRASGNVTSITDNGTGDYTINFTTAMPDANYSMTLGQRRTIGSSSVGCIGAYNYASSSARINTYNTGFSLADFESVEVAVFR